MLPLPSLPPPTPTITATSPPALPPQEILARAAWRAGVIGALNIASQVLAARLIVLIAVLGGIVLTFTALGNPDPYRIGTLLIYAVGVVLPSVWLAGR